MANNDPGQPIPVGGGPSTYSNQYGQYAYESNPQTTQNYEDKIKEKATITKQALW